MKEVNQFYIINESIFSKLADITVLYVMPVYCYTILCTLLLVLVLFTICIVLFVSHIYHYIAMHILLFVLRLNPVAVLLFPFLVFIGFNLLNFTLNITDYLDTLYMEDSTGQGSSQSVNTVTTNTGQQSNTDDPVPNRKPLSDLRYRFLDKGTQYYIQDKDDNIEYKYTRHAQAVFVYDAANPQAKPHEFMYRSDRKYTMAIQDIDGSLHHGFVKDTVTKKGIDSEDFGVIYKEFQRYANEFNVVSRGHPVTVSNNSDITLRKG